MKYYLAAAGVLAGANVMLAQTRIDLHSQSKGADISNQSTKTSQVGGTLPGACGSGESFILTTADPGKNLYLCIGGAWAQVAGGTDLRVGPADQDKMLSNDGATVQWQAIGGDATGPARAIQVTGLKGRPLGDTTPNDGDTLRWQTSTAAWESAPPVEAGPGIALTGSMLSVDDAVVPIYYTGTAAPAIACVSGRDYYVDTANSDLYYCASAAWSKVGKPAVNPIRSFGVTIDGGGTAIAPGIAGYITTPYACVISGWSLQADQAGSISIDIWKAAQAVPTSAGKINGNAPPALSGAQLAQSTAVTGWSTAVSANDVVGFNVTSAATLTRATLAVNCQ